MNGKPSKDEQIGFHKGALSTLAKEREELTRMIGTIEQLMHMHIKALQGLDVELGANAKGKERNADRKK